MRCVCRDPSNELATILRKDLTQIESLKARKGTFELVQGDLLDKSSLLRAFDGAWGVFLVTTWATTPWKLMRDRMEPPTMDGVQIERKQGQNAIEAAIEKQITYFIYTSVGGLQDDYCGIAYWNSKLDVERMLKAKAPPAGMKWAILSPCMFFDVSSVVPSVPADFLLIMPVAVTELEHIAAHPRQRPRNPRDVPGQGRLKLSSVAFQTNLTQPIPNQTRMRFTAVKDIGWFGAHMFANMDKTAGKKLELATDIMSCEHSLL